MSAFRDEHAALLERVAHLEEDLAAARAGDTNRDALASELGALTERVEAAMARADGDRRALAEVRGALERIRSSMGLAPRPAPPSAAAPAPTQVGTREGAAQPSRGWVLLLIAVVVAASVVLVLLYLPSSTAVTSPPAPPETLDPSALLAPARQQAEAQGLPPGGQLVRIRGTLVASDGLLHTREKSYSASAQYVFAPPSPPPAPAPSAPLGVPPPFQFQTTFTVTVDAAGTRASRDTLSMFHETAVPNPHCTFADVWAAARGAGAPEGAVAIIEYSWDMVVSTAEIGSRPRWHFTIESTAFAYDISDVDCSVIR